MAVKTIAVNLRPLYPGRIGGMEIYVRSLLDRWIGEGLSSEEQWILFSNSQNHDSFSHLKERCERILLPEKNYEDFIAAKLGELRPDMYFCPLLSLEPPNPPVPAAVSIPDLQHEFFPGFFSDEVLEWRRRTFPASVHRATCVFTISEFSKKTFVDKLGVAPEKVFVTPPIIDAIFRRSPDPAAAERIKNRYSLPEEFIYYPANFWPHKNHEALLRAFAKARDTVDALFLVLTGAKDKRNETLERAAQDLGISSWVRYLGHIDRSDVPYLYRSARALVFPSLFEGFGIPIVEAFGCGCPVVCSNTTSCPEVAGDGALLVDPLNDEALAAAIEEICLDDSTRARLVEAGKPIFKRYAASRAAEDTLDRMREAMAVRGNLIEGSDELPPISIVTPSFEQAEFIDETIRSVLTQDYPHLEYWVIDGGSKDGTLDVLQSHGEKLHWVSEKDAGQADAVNKGFQRFTGDVVGWLNSDDTYLPGTLQYVGRFFAQNPSIDVVYGDAYYIDRAGTVVQPYRTLDYSHESLAHECYICQPTVFFRRGVLDRVGLLNPDLRTTLDYDFWIRLFSLYPPVRLPRFLATSRMYAENKTLALRTEVYRELFQTVRKHYGYIPYSWVFGYASYLAHRNDQFHDPRKAGVIEVGLALALMAWHNRANPQYLWRWITSRRHGFRTEVLKRVGGTRIE